MSPRLTTIPSPLRILLWLFAASNLLSAARVSAQAIDTTLWVADAQVNAVVRSGNTLYLGGNFTRLAPASGGAVPIDATTGLALALPKVTGTVNAVAPDGAGGWYVGGDFTAVRGVARQNLARILNDNTVSSWNPGANGSVSSLVVSGSTVYAGGTFTFAGGQVRNRIAAIDAITGNATAWNPNANGTVNALMVVGSSVYAGGAFNSIGGQPRNRIAELDATVNTNNAEPWNPDADGDVFALLMSGSTVYAGGAFMNIGGQTRNRIAGLNSAAHATAWNPDANAPVNALAISGTTIYAGGSFTAIGGQTRNNIAALDATVNTNNATAWNPNSVQPVNALAVSGSTVYAGGSFTFIGGQVRHRIAALDATTGNATAWNPGAGNTVLALAVNGSVVYAGGSFTCVGGQARNFIGALDATTGAAIAWHPNANGTIFELVVSGSTVYACGSFNFIGGQARNSLAALDATTGNATAWNPNANSLVFAVVPDGSTVYAGGLFTNIGGQARSRIAALDVTTGNATAWNPGSDSDVYVLAPVGGTVYAGGVFNTIGGQTRNQIAALDATTGNATSWNPNANGFVGAIVVSGSTVYAGGVFNTIGGQTRNQIAALDAATGSATSWNPNANGAQVTSLAVAGNVIYAGGVFTTIGGQARNYVAALNATTGLATDWNPNLNNFTFGLLVSGSTVYLGTGASRTGVWPQSCIVATAASASLIGVFPTSGSNAGPLTLTVHGSGLTPGTILRLERSGQPTIVATGVVVAADGNSLSGTLNLEGALAGLWNVVVVTPDLQTNTLTDAFTIEGVRAPQLRVSIMGPALQGGSFVVRRDRRTAYDVVIENPGNVDALYVPLWLAGIPADATVELDFALSYPAQEGGEPNWSTVPLYFTSAGGRYVPLVIPRVPPGRVSRRVFITVPGPSHAPFTLTGSVTAPWVDGEKFRSCIAAGGITNPACMGTQLTTINASLAANPTMQAMSGIALWAKVAWQCEGAGSLPAALTKAEQVLDYLDGPVEGGVVGAGCEGVVSTWWREVMAVSVVGAVDPNDKLGAQGTLTGTQALPYTIRFENLASASAPAQQVVVTDQLSPSTMELTTVSLDAICFGNRQIHPPPGLKSYSTRVDLRPGTNLLVDVAASLDPFTHVLSWYFTSIDPATGLAPTNPNVGFLPPNTSPPAGEGSVLFTVMPKIALANGTLISNAGNILFDDPPTMNTPTWTNGVDNAAPASHVLPLTANSHQPSITVSWTADGSPPDLRDFTIYVKQDAGPYRVWRQNTTATSDTLKPPPDRQFHTFSFYSVARDQIGNIEAATGSADATTVSTTGVGEPGTPSLALKGAWPNPSAGPLHVGLTLPSREHATLELLDVAGRRVLRREVGSLGPGSHVVSLAPPHRLRPGLYFLSLSQGPQVLRTRVAIIRE